jgi:DNA repair ATPase RecN
MVSGVAKVLIDNASEKTILDDILRRVGKTAGQRNKYVHDTWGVADTSKHEIFQIRDQANSSQKMEQVTIPDMQAAAAQIRKLAEETNAFRQRIAPKVPAWIDKYQKLPGLGLVYAPKGHPPGRKPKGFHNRP